MQTARRTNIEHDRELLDHIEQLGLDSVEAYRSWCVDNGFGKRLNKHWKQRARERHRAQATAVETRLRSKKRETRNPLLTIHAICEGQVEEHALTQPHLVRFCEAVKAHTHPRRKGRRRTIDALLQLIAHLHACRTRLLDGTPAFPDRGTVSGNTYLEALVLLATHSRRWRRPVEAWTPLDAECASPVYFPIAASVRGL